MNKSKLSKILSIVLPSSLVLIAIILIVISVFNAQSYDANYVKNEKTIASLQSELDGLKRVKTASADEIKTQLYSAATVGNDVAELQNSYKDAFSMMSADESAKKQKEISDSLSKYFTDDDGKKPWFITGHDYVWQFKTTYSVTDSTIPTLFLCYENPDDVTTLVAYTTATYNAEMNKFYDVSVNITAYGNKVLSSDVTPGVTGATE